MILDFFVVALDMIYHNNNNNNNKLVTIITEPQVSQLLQYSFVKLTLHHLSTFEEIRISCLDSVGAFLQTAS